MIVDGSRIARARWLRTLNALVNASLRESAPPLARTAIRYRREPLGREQWQTAAETFARGEGDCEDLSIYLARDFRARGIPAHVVIKRTRSGGLHALVLARVHGRTLLLDPSKARGM